MPQFLGSFWCDHCSDSLRRPVWLLEGGSRLCKDHFLHITGYPPPAPPALDDLVAAGAAPAAAPAWTKLVPGLRMRPSEHVPHGIELQGVRNVQLDQGVQTVSLTPAWTIPDAQLVELVLMASAHRDDNEANKLLVRSALLRILHGTTPP